MRARVVSVPCFELFDASRARTTRPRSSATAPVKVAIEAAVRMGWDRFIGTDGIFIGMKGFGASAPYRGALREFRHHRRRPAAKVGTRPAWRPRPAPDTDRRRTHGRQGCDQRVRPDRPEQSSAPSSNPAARTSRSSAINDLGPVETNAHLLRYDSVHGRFPHEVKVDGDTIDVGRGPIKVTAIKNPAELPWKELDVDIALECTGIFTSKEKASAHLQAGAKRVLVSAPADGADLTVVYGVNDDKLTQGPHRRLQRLLHHQLPRAGGLSCSTRPSASSTAS